ncbi:Elongator complex protein 1 [Halotydeus destructor]|nr:Elongator complex protein 1 [Halotydeus destructor]
MRNLSLEHHSSFNYDQFRNFECFTIDSDNQRLFGVSSEGCLLCLHIDTKEVTVVCPLSENVKISGIEYLVEGDQVCLALASGDLLTVTLENDVVELVGSVPSGIISMAWSGDQEYLVIVTGDEKLILMSRTFDPISEKELNPQEYGSGKAVNVGWGSKSTQFHGSEGKTAAKAKTEIQELSQSDDKQVRISWKSDGDYFAVSSIDSSQNCRVVRIWSSNAELLHTSEPVVGLEHCLSWKPAGHLIASSCQRYGKHEIIFYEKNGLTHGGFKLPFEASVFTIKDVAWSSDAKILSVWGQYQMKDYIFLYTIGNYHWYLKQTLEFSSSSGQPSTLKWDTEKPMRLHITLNDGTYSYYTFKWSTCSSGNSEVAVVDGKKLLLTPFNSCVIPPPMCAYTVDFPEYVREVGFDNESKIYAYLSDKRLFCIDYNNNLCAGWNSSDEVKIISGSGTLHKRTFELPSTCSFYQLPSDSNFYHFSFVDNAIIAVEENNGKRTLSKFEPSNAKKSVINDLDLDDVKAAATYKNTIAIELLKSKIVMKLESNDELLKKFSEANDCLLLQSCADIKLAYVGQEMAVFGLSENGQLCCNSTLLLRNCSSFLIHENKFLLFTLTSNTLNCWSLETQVNMKLSGKEFDEKQEEKPTEPGSKLVTSTKLGGVVIQTPRGNLETVYPRLLLWHSVVKRLDEQQYLQAFEIMRKHRMNLNLLHDRDPQHFLDNIDKFIDSLKDKISYLNLFISDLSEELITPPGISLKPPTVKHKVSKLCHLLRQKMTFLDASKFLQPIIASLVKEGKVGEALLKIKELSEQSEQDDALKFILYMIDVNALCDEALGTYDLDIVLIVASKSQKDPKEYSQFLNEIRNYSPEEYKRYKIDVHLKRFAKALGHIAKCEDTFFAEAVELIDQKRLYKEAITVFESQAQLDIIWKKYAEYLLSKRYYNESALAFQRAKDPLNAVKSYQLSGNWNAAIVASLSLGDSQRTLSLCCALVDNLKSQGKFLEASLVAKNYLKDDTKCYQLLLDGRDWDNARRALSELENDDNLIHGFKAKLLEHFESSMEHIDFNLTNLTRNVERLQCVRKENLRRANECFEYDAIPDNASDISGVASSTRLSGSRASGSIGTRKTSRTSRKVPRAYSMKEGSATEDLALITAVKDIVVNSTKLQDEIGVLLRHLCENYLEVEANKLQISFDNLIQTIDSRIPLVWPSRDGTYETTTDNIASSLNVTELIADPELRIPPTFKKINWKFLFAESI